VGGGEAKREKGVEESERRTCRRRRMNDHDGGDWVGGRVEGAVKGDVLEGLEI